MALYSHYLLLGGYLIRISVKLICSALLFGFIASCSIWGSDFMRASQIGEQGGLQYRKIVSPPFVFATWSRIHEYPGQADPLAKSELVVYIEGDGAAWINRSQVSPDPTPSNPVALRLAAIDAHLNPDRQILYLARPCQYVSFSDNLNCKSFYWSTGRYSEEVIHSMDVAISQIARQVGAQRIQLVGYSGGAAVALLIASRRRDVTSIRTVAGNVDPEGLNKIQSVSPLASSLNPRNYVEQLSRIPQLYWVGGDDSLITFKFTQGWTNRLSSGCVALIEIPHVSHTEGWEGAWPNLLNSSLPSPRDCLK